MSKELEEAKRTLIVIRNIFEHLKNHGWINDIKREVEPNEALQAIEIALNHIDNSIPTEVIEKKIEKNRKLINECEQDEEHYGEVYIYKHNIEILKELSEGKNEK